jgi:hypothetical protein
VVVVVVVRVVSSEGEGGEVKVRGGVVVRNGQAMSEAGQSEAGDWTGRDEAACGSRGIWSSDNATATCSSASHRIVDIVHVHGNEERGAGRG